MIPFTISRYVGSLFLKWVVLLLGIFTSFIMLFDFTELQRRAASRATPISFLEKGGMVLLKIPFLLEQLLPFLIFWGALGLFWRLNRYCELIILRTSGFSVWQISFSPLILALLIGGADLTLVQPFSTFLLKQYQHKDIAYFNQPPAQTLSISSSGLWIKKNEPEASVVYQIHNINPAQQTVDHISVYVFSLKQEFLVRYDAAQAQLLPHQITLKDVWILPFEGPARFEKEYVLPFQLTLAHIYNHGPDPQVVSFWHLSELIDLLEQAGVSSHKYVLQKTSLWARPFWLGAMILLAAAFSFRTIRKGKTMGLLLLGGFSCFFLYVIKDITYALGRAEKLPFFLAAWTPAVLTFLLAIALLFHLEEGKA